MNEPTFRVEKRQEGLVLVPAFNEPSLTLTEREKYDELRAEYGEGDVLKPVVLTPVLRTDTEVSLDRVMFYHEHPTTAGEAEKLNAALLEAGRAMWVSIVPVLRALVSAIERVQRVRNR